MEIPVINRMTELEASISSLNNPSLISRLISTLELNSSVPFQFCKWGALFLTLLYAFALFAYKIKILVLHFHSKSKSLLSSVSDPLQSHFDDEFSADDGENDDVCSSSDDDDEEEEVPSSSCEELTRFDEDFQVKGSSGNFSENPWQKRKLGLRRRRSIGDNFSLSELVNANGVVKLWESSIPAVSFSPTVTFTAGACEDGRLGLGLWDFRMKWESPAVQTEWKSDWRGRAVRVGIDSGRTGKVYVRDDRSMGLTVGDVRMADTALENLTESGEATWWDADGVTSVAESKNDFPFFHF